MDGDTDIWKFTLLDAPTLGPASSISLSIDTTCCTLNGSSSSSGFIELVSVPNSVNDGTDGTPDKAEQLPTKRIPRTLDWYKNQSGNSDDYEIIKRAIRVVRIDDIFDMFSKLGRSKVKDIVVEALHKHQQNRPTSKGFCMFLVVLYSMFHDH
jgi:hypothetical protein